MIVFNTCANFHVHAWCLCGFHTIKSGNDLDVAKKRRKTLKREGCPKCGGAWMSFDIRENR